MIEMALQLSWASTAAATDPDAVQRHLHASYQYYTATAAAAE